jgi:hypothetical protein
MQYAAKTLAVLLATVLLTGCATTVEVASPTVTATAKPSPEPSRTATPTPAPEVVTPPPAPVAVGENLTGHPTTDIQKALGAAENGVLDAETTRLLKEWQSSHGLEPDGVFGPRSASVMFPPPGYEECINRVDPARTAPWVIGPAPHYGMVEDLGGGAMNVTLGTHVPEDLRCSVVVHEWIHILQIRQMGGLRRTMDIVGGRGEMEAIADCGALVLGATWTNYGCNTDGQRDYAARLLAGERW